MTYKRGDVVLVYYPNSDGKSAKKRPALVVQSDEIETGLSQKLLALITSNLERIGATRVLIAQNTDLGRQMGLISDSVVVTDNLATVRDYMFLKKIGYCSEMEAVNTALRETFGL